MDCKEFYESEYTRFTQLIHESTDTIFLSSSDEDINEIVDGYINSMRILKNSLFFIARILLRSAQRVTNETRGRFLGQTGDFIKKRMKFLGILRERLSVMLSPETLEDFMNPDTCLRNLDSANLAVAMVGHIRLGENSGMNVMDSELLKMVLQYSFPVRETFPVSRRLEIFNANKYCSFVKMYNIQSGTDEGRKLDRWMKRSDVFFQVVKEPFQTPPASDAVTAVLTPSAQETSGSADSTPDSAYSQDSSQTLENFRTAGFIRRSLF